MRRTRSPRLVLVALALALAVAPAAGAADSIFNPALLHEFRIVMDPQDWTSLQKDFLSNQYYAANISLDGEGDEGTGLSGCEAEGTGTRFVVRGRGRRAVDRTPLGRHGEVMRQYQSEIVEDVSSEGAAAPGS